MSNNLIGKLHTKTVDYNEPKFYTELNKGRLKRKFDFSNEIQHLQEIESHFYAEIFNDTNMTFSEFIERIQNIFKSNTGDAQCIRYLANSEHGDQTLYQFLRNEMRFFIKDSTLTTATNVKKQKKIASKGETKSVKELRENYGKLELLFSNNNFGNKDGTIQIKVRTSSGRISSATKYQNLSLDKKVLDDIIKQALSQNITLEQLYTTIIPNTTSFLNQELLKLERDMKKNGTLPTTYHLKTFAETYVAQQIRPYIIPTLQESLGYTGKNGEENTKIFYDFVIGRVTTSNYVYGADKGDILYKSLLHTFTKLKASPLFFEAFKKAWNTVDEKGKKIVVLGLQQQNSAAVSGILGELGGIVLIYYLSNMGLRPKWTALEVLDKLDKEQSRADIMLKTFGIQVKNYQENNLTKKTTVNLHPFQVMQQLAGTLGNTTEGQELETAFANMAFNKDFADGIVSKLERYLRQYVGFLANLKMSIDSTVQDTSGIWLVGGTMLVPGSAILKQLEVDLNNEAKNQLNVINITYSKVSKGDEDYAELGRISANKKRKTPNFVEYWVHKREGWDFINATEFENMLQSTNVSIHTRIRLNNIINGLKTSGDCYFLNRQ